MSQFFAQATFPNQIKSLAGDEKAFASASVACSYYGPYMQATPTPPDALV
jgi:hypothetical protein